MVAASTWARRLGITLLVVLLALLVQQALHPTPSAAAPVVVTPPGLKVAEVTAGATHACFLEPSGEVACWGGQGAEQPPSSAGPFSSINAGGLGTCGLQQDGSIVCWAEGTLRSVAGSYRSVSSGGELSGCALAFDDSVTCWMPDGTDTTLTHHEGEFSSVDAGNGHACAIKSDASITCWGADDAGQAPAEVAGSYVSVSAAASSTCAVRTDGDLVCWGDNSQGQSPAHVSGPFTTVSSMPEHTCAVRATGTAVCWGWALDGVPSPVEVAGGFRAVAASSSFVCAIRTDDLLSCWGQPEMMPASPSKLEPDPYTQATETAPYRHGFTVWSNSAITPSVKGSLPAGLTLAAGTGSFAETELVVSGTPRKRGTYQFTLVATNPFGTSEMLVTVRVLPPPGYDVNGDGIPDLPVGAPGEDVGSTVDAGQVIVLLGAADGSYGRKGAVSITQETLGHHSERGDRFGAAITTGEVTGDNYVDLIIGVPGEDKGAGQVVVVSGSAKGLAGARNIALKQGVAGAAGAAEAGDGFGSAVSVGDGLWVGAPGEDLGRASDAGVVTKFLTAPLRTAGSVQYQQGARKVPGTPEKGDRFGASLAGGSAMIGAPGEDVGRIVDAGAVTGQLKYALTQDSEGVPGGAEAGDQFGAALAITSRLWATDVNGDWYSYHGIGIGAPGEDVGSVKDAGMIIWGSSEIFDYDEESGGVEDVVQNSWTPAQRLEAGDRFGAAITLSADGRKIVVGAPGEDVGSVKDAGAVTALSLCDDCSTGAVVATLDQNSAGVPGAVRAGSQFGATLAERPGTAGGYVVGAPGETVSGKAGAGAVVVMPTKGTAQELHQDSPGIPGGAELGDRFGTVPTP